MWLDNWKCAPSTPLIHFLASCKKESPQSLLSLVWFWWIMFAGFRCGLNLNTEMCRAWSPPPQKKPKQSLLPVVSSPKTLCFWAEHPSFLHRTPSVTLLPPLPLSLSLSLCFYLGAVRAPLLKLLLKREHIQRGLSQSLSVSIKDPGNTTLSREPLLKGQWDPGSFFFSFLFSPIPSFSWERRKKQEFYAANQLFMNGMWTLQSLVPAGTEHHHHHHHRHLRPNRRSHLRHHSLQQHDVNPHCCSAPHIWWESGTAAFIYTAADASVCFDWNSYVQTNSQTLWWHNPGYVER